jgi:hypothetical protein
MAMATEKNGENEPVKQDLARQPGLFAGAKVVI